MQELVERYGVSMTVVVGAQKFPVLGIQMMSDEEWQRMARENAVRNFTKLNGREPVDVEEALKWQRTLVRELTE